ncbi:MAG: hypothetical protein AAB267_04730, partial [Candidatus Desantisbacteria bacterium]
MGAELKRAEKEANSKIKNAQKELNKLNKELTLDGAQATLDFVGIADPTPISDGINAVISLGRGDFIGAGLSVISIVPLV